MKDPTYATVRVEHHGPVHAVVLNRPEVRNSIDLVIRQELAAALRAADSDPSCRAILLAGTGPVFCAGGDIKTLTADPEASQRRLSLVGEVARSIVKSRTPVVAAVQGGAYGAGLALAAACDVVVGGEAARFVASFGRFGLIGDTGIYYSLRQRMPPARAREILLLNANLSAQEAFEAGLVTRVVPDGEVWEEGWRLAQQLAGMAPAVNAWTKRIIAQPEQDFESVLATEIAAQVELIGTPSFAEGQRAFVEKRTPHWWDDVAVGTPGDAP